MAKDNILGFLGFDEKTERVYRALLHLADAPATKIAQETGLVRTSIYHILEHLINVGLVSTYISRGVRRFVCENPNKIKAYLEQRLILAERVVPELQKEITRVPGDLYIKTYRGLEAIKGMTEEILETKEKLVLSIGSSRKFLEFVGGKYGYGHRRRMEGIIARSIRFKNDEPSTNSKLNQTKLLGQDIEFPGYILIYDKKVAIILFEKNGLGFTLESQNFSTMMRALFDLIWTKL